MTFTVSRLGNLFAVERAFVEQHLHEADIVVRRRGETAAAGFA